MIDKDVPLDELSAGLVDVLVHWRALGGEDLACAWSDFHLEGLSPKLLPTTMVVDIKDDMAKNTFRFWGTGIRHINGKDMTGKTMADLSPPDFREIVYRNHAKMIAEPRASASEYGFQRDDGFEHLMTVIRLPLSDDGRAVHHIIVVIEWAPAGHELKSRRFETGIF